MSREEKDGFWDIGKLVPQKRAGLSRFSGGPTLSPVTLPPTSASTQASAADERRLTQPQGTAKTEDMTYVPAGNPLLLSVTVRRRPGGYSFYEQFRRDAGKYFDLLGDAVPYVPFFSYTPQYNQLSDEQRAYYLYFRTEVREGRYPKADKGYFFLLVYEIINLPDRIPPKEGARMLATLWDAYRRELSGIDRYMIPWLTDYCLVHALPCPELSPDCLFAAAEGDGVEFFFGNAAEATPEGILRMLHLSSDYRFESSRAVTDENRALFTHHIVGAMGAVLPHLFGAGLIGRGEHPETVRRRAFAGSLCSHNVRAELEYTYISLRRSEGLRRTVGLAVKYAENHLRAALGIRARLSASALAPSLREIIDRYFAGVRTALAPRREPAPEPAYQRLYDAEETGIDRASAAAIESSSWELTRRLVIEEDEILPILPTGAEPEREITSAEPPSVADAPGDPLSALVEAFLLGGDAPTATARRLGLLPAQAAETVNEAFVTLLGDVLVEPCGDGFVLIEDYREDAEQWLTIHKK